MLDSVGSVGPFKKTTRVADRPGRVTSAGTRGGVARRTQGPPRDPVRTVDDGRRGWVEEREKKTGDKTKVRGNGTILTVSEDV